jgi:two-component sensor histidine kinase
MTALLPHLVTTLGASVMLAVVHGYLLSIQRTRALALWTAAWSVYALRFVAGAVLVVRPDAAVALWLNQAAGVVSGLLLLWGAIRHTSGARRVPWYWIACAVALLGWLSVAVPLAVDRPILFTPVFAFLAAANFGIAIAYARTRAFSRPSRLFVATVFVLWGLHKLDYPLLRMIPEAAIWGYTIGTLFTIAAGVGLLLVYLEQAHAELERSVREKATLLREIHHRVKNNLQIIVSLLRLQSQEVGDVATRRALEDTMARVASMAEVHERLYESSSLTSVAFTEYLRELGARIMAMHTCHSSPARLEVRGDPAPLDVATAIPLGLIATELVSNAAEHAVCDRPDGRVEVSFSVTDAGLTLTVGDNGPGLPQGFSPTGTQSLGMALVVALCDQLGAELEWHSGDGTRFDVRAPASGEDTL